MKNILKEGRLSEPKGLDEIRKYYSGFTGLGNKELLRKKCQEAENMAGMAIVIIRLNMFNKLNMLFGMDVTENTTQKLAEMLQDYAESIGGTVFEINMDSLLILAPFGERNLFIQKLKAHLLKMEQVNFRQKDIIYRQHYAFTYLVYFFDSDQGYKPDVDQIIDSMMFRIRQLGNTTKTSGAVFNDSNSFDWKGLKNLRQDILDGWERREFFPYYQLIHDVRSKRAIGAEMLARWKHPQRGILGPQEFLLAMEHEGLSMELDMYMLEEACRTIRHWLDEELVTVPITVNLSKLNLHREDFLKRIYEIVNKYDIPGVLLILEVEESLVLSELDEYMIRIMKELHDYGFQLSMDRFAATELSSVNVLRYIQTDMIKLSPAFFPDEAADSREKIFVRDVFRMLRDMGIKAVAERVETAEEVEQVKKFGCECAQGFYYSMPMSNSEFEEVIF